MNRRKIETVIFDMDGTIGFRNTHDASYNSFFRYMGLEAEANQITARYEDKVHNVMSQDNHQRQFEETVALLRSKRASLPQDVFPSIPYAPGFQQFCQYLRSHKINTGIVTLSLLYAANRIKEENDIQLAYANEIHIENGKCTGTGKIHVLFGNKGEMTKKAYQALGGTKETTVYIGDSLNDIDPWNSVGLPLGINLHHPDCKNYVQEYFDDFYEIQKFFEKNVKLKKI